MCFSLDEHCTIEAALHCFTVNPNNPFIILDSLQVGLYIEGYFEPMNLSPVALFCLCFMKVDHLMAYISDMEPNSEFRTFSRAALFLSSTSLSAMSIDGISNPTPSLPALSPPPNDFCYPSNDELQPKSEPIDKLLVLPSANNDNGWNPRGWDTEVWGPCPNHSSWSTLYNDTQDVASITDTLSPTTPAMPIFLSCLSATDAHLHPGWRTLHSVLPTLSTMYTSNDNNPI